MNKKAALLIGCFFWSWSLLAQIPNDSLPKWKEKIDLSGYIKLMQINSVVDTNELLTEQLIHNRLNLKYYATDQLTFSTEIRNRVFYGEGIKLKQPLFAHALEKDAGEADLSWVLAKGDAFVLHSMVDRANVTYTKGNWEIKAGRQRINWGINLAWNPNDLFNAYNFADFDYIERPGTDALRVQYYTSSMSTIEGAIKPGKDKDSWIGGGLYKFNKWNYDIQLLAAWYNKDLAVGAGWAGNIKDAGFKGELTYFHPREDISDTTGILNTSVSFDYAFKNATYINVAVLYNTNGITSALATGENNVFTTRRLSPKMLMPSQLTYFVQVSKPFTPAINGSLSAMYLQGVNIAFAMPSITYTINESWDIDLLGQFLAGENDKTFKSLGNTVFVRLMLSF